ncbi:unnamed protein product, partial [Ixodes hexagonus]
LLEVKCPISKIGMTPEEACADERFCCALVDGEVHLKRSHAFFYQVQGQMMTIYYDEEFVEGELLPGLLYFSEHALFPEVITHRIRRHKTLANGNYIPYKQFCKGAYRVQDGPGLRKTFCKLK